MNNYGSLQIDKEDVNVSYNDELHKYWTKKGNKDCVSVTTLIHQYQNFDEVFWSKYKALESLLSKDDFSTVKSLMTKNKIFNNVYYEQFDISEDDFNEAVNVILAEWKVKRDESCVRGTKIHLGLEMENLAGNTPELKHYGLGGTFKTDTTNNIKGGVKGVYPELLVSRVSEDGILRLAGQADLIIVDGFDVYICDYKTSKKIDKKSFFDTRTKKATTMKYPLNNIQDTNFWHYSLQLSIYGWMIQKIDPRFNIKSLMLIHYDHDGGVTNYECDYLKNDVIKLLTFHKKKLIDQDFKNKNKKIVF